MDKSLFDIQKFDSFNVYKYKDSLQFFHIDITNEKNFYENLFEYFFSEDKLLRYCENTSFQKFTPTKKNYVILYKHLKTYIDSQNLEISAANLEKKLLDILEKEGALILQDGKNVIRLDKMGKIGEYIFCCLLSDYFHFDCILPKVHLQTDYNMSVYGIDTLFYSQNKDLLLFGESKLSKSVKNGIALINSSLKEYEKQLEDEFTLVLSDRVLKNNLNIFTKKYGKIVEECISIQKFIEEAKIQHIGIPIFIAHGTELIKEDILNKLKKINKTTFFNIDTQYFLITLPIISKEKLVIEFTKYIRIKEDEYESKTI